MREKFSTTPKRNGALEREHTEKNKCSFIFMSTFNGESDLPGQSKDLYVFTEQNEFYYAPREIPTHDQQTASSWQKYLPVPLNPQQIEKLRSELLPQLRRKSKFDHLERQFTNLNANELKTLKKITGHTRKSTRGPIELERIWHRVSWLPGYLVHEFSGTGRKRRPYEKVTAYRLAWQKLKDTYVKGEKLAFPIFKIANFTLIKEEHCKLLLSERITLGIPAHVFHITSNPLGERSQSKLAHHIQRSHSDLIEDLQAFKSYTHSKSFQTNRATWLSEQQVRAPKQEAKKAFMTSPRAFRYFGNSLNYLDSIEKVIAHSPEFARATVVKDVTCGSCALTFYLAQKYPHKKYIASDINGELINLLNYIKETSWENIEKSYREHHDRCHNSPADQRTAVFNQMIAEYNEHPLPKDYSLLLFIQNNAFTNVAFKGTQIRAYLLQEGVTKVDTTLKLLHRSKELIDKGNIEFKQMDMHEALSQAKPGEICFMTPPHEHDHKKLYQQKISIDELSASIKQLQERQIPFLLTYGDNSEQQATNLLNIIHGLNRYSYIVTGGRKKLAKVLSVYFSQNLVAPSELEELHRGLRMDAERLITKATKGLRQLKETKNAGENNDFSETEEQYIQTIELAKQILNTPTEVPQTSSSEMAQTDETYVEEVVRPMNLEVKTQQIHSDEDSESELEGEETDLEEDSPQAPESSEVQTADSFVDIWQFLPSQEPEPLRQPHVRPFFLSSTSNKPKEDSRVLPSISELFPFLHNSRRASEADKLEPSENESHKRKKTASRQVGKNNLSPDYKRARASQYFDFFSNDSATTSATSEEPIVTNDAGADDAEADHEVTSFSPPSSRS